MRNFNLIIFIILIINSSCSKHDVELIDVIPTLSSSYLDREISEISSCHDTASRNDGRFTDGVLFRLESCSKYSDSEVTFVTGMRCISRVFKGLGRVQSEVCKTPLIKLSRDVLSKVVENSIKRIEFNDEKVVSSQSLVAFFNIFSTYHLGAKKLLYRPKQNESVSHELLENTDYLVKKLWEHLFSNQNRSHDLLIDENGFKTALNTNLNVIKSAISAKLVPIPLAIVLGDALTPIYERVSYLAKIKDIICKIEKCDTGQQRDDEIYELLKTMSSLTDIQEIPQSTQNIKSSENLARVFELLASRSGHDVVAKMLIDIKKMYGGFESVSSRDYWTNTTPKLSLYFAPLHKSLSESFDQIRSFEKTGYYSGKSIFTSDVGFAPDKLKQTIKRHSKLVSKFNTETQKYVALREKTTLSTSHEEKGRVIIERLKLKYKQLINSYINSYSDFEGITQSMQDDNYRYAQYISGAMKTISSTRFRNVYAKDHVVTNKEKIMVSSSDLYEPILKFNMKLGEMVQFNISGAWSPTCAINLAPQFKYSVVDPQIGPEGYKLDVSNSVFENETDTASESSNDFKRSSNSIQECANRSIRTSMSDNSNTSTNSTISNRDSKTSSKIVSAASSTNKSHTSGRRTEGTTSYQTTRALNISVGTGIYNVPVAGWFTSARIETSLTRSKTTSDTRSKFKMDTVTEATTDTTTNNESAAYEYSKTEATTTGSVLTDTREQSEVNSDSSCLGVNSGRTYKTNSDSSQSTQRNDRTRASYSTGLRLGNTPIPTAPVGSLLLIEIPVGEGNLKYAKNVSVIGRNSKFLAEEDSDYYIIGNDCRGEDRTNKLFIGFSKYIPVDIEAINLTKKILLALGIVKNKERLLLDMGEISTMELNNLKAKILAQLTSEGAEVNRHPFLRELFDYWITNELTLLQRKSKIVQLERRLTSLAIDIHQTRLELQNAKFEAKVNYLLQTWDFHNMDLSQLGPALDNVLKSINNNVLLTLKFKYPAVLRRLSRDRKLEGLRGLSIFDSLLKVSEVLNELVKNIPDDVEEEVFLQPVEQNTSTVILSVPNPYYKTNCAGLPYDTVIGSRHDSCSDGEISPQYYVSREFKTTYPTVSRAVAQNIWKQLIDGKKKISISITPEDLYRSTKNVRTRFLECDSITPVIMNTAIMFSTEDVTADDLNKLGMETRVETDRKLIFPTINHREEYSLAHDSVWHKFTTPLLFGNSIEAKKIFDKHLNLDQDTGVGRSPFSNFLLANLRNHDGKIDELSIKEQISELLIIFKLYVERSEDEIKWLKSCQI
ncbi:MAG: hypothetical protein ISR65_17235 [Bacteriovoracaceae bacterium]|nr:hypothetical protein [Bacteriovoracaceae bacterium]